LVAKYDLQAARKSFPKSLLGNRLPSLWRYSELLPIEREENVVSLGERTSPISPLPTLGKILGVPQLLMKDEGQLPTGSFKSRGLAMAVSKAKELGIQTVCIPSAGNAAGALAAYAARAGIEAFIFLPEDTPEINIKECLACGSHVELVKGNISDAAKRMNELKKTNPGWFDVSTLKEPYRLEGKKTMGYEIAEQMGWQLPDVVVYPTGGGTGLIGMWKAFDEMEELGWIGKKRPKMVSVQSSGCAPIAKAFKEHKPDSQFWENAATIASGLRVPKAFADHLILDAIYKSGGSAVAVGDDEITAMVYELAKTEGFFICPEGAASFASLRHLLSEGEITEADRVLVFNTAAGIKYPDVIKR
jgi:threonine synthase